MLVSSILVSGTIPISKESTEAIIADADYVIIISETGNANGLKEGAWQTTAPETTVDEVIEVDITVAETPGITTEDYTIRVTYNTKFDHVTKTRATTEGVIEIDREANDISNLELQFMSSAALEEQLILSVELIDSKGRVYEIAADTLAEGIVTVTAAETPTPEPGDGDEDQDTETPGEETPVEENEDSEGELPTTGYSNTGKLVGGISTVVLGALLVLFDRKRKMI